MHRYVTLEGRNVKYFQTYYFRATIVREVPFYGSFISDPLPSKHAVWVILVDFVVRCAKKWEIFILIHLNAISTKIMFQ